MWSCEDLWFSPKKNPALVDGVVQQRLWVPQTLSRNRALLP